MRKTEKTEWRFEYKGVYCEIVFWSVDGMKENLDIYKSGGIWNSYIFIRKDKLPKLFKRASLRLQTKPNPFDKGKPNPRKDSKFDYWKLDFEMASGITFYEKMYDVRGKVCCIKIGNDYNHIWNGGEDERLIKTHLIDTIDELLPTHIELIKKPTNLLTHSRITNRITIF